MSKIIRNGIIIYQSRRNQFGHMTLEQFMNDKHGQNTNVFTPSYFLFPRKIKRTKEGKR